MPNALAGETSPYLLQHADNPVDWMPWGAAAFERAQREIKPVLLSIGYSACHWCHVMDRESFQNVDTAALMNARFINVKVDREERPDIDAMQVRALQLMGRRPGWPITIFLTPEGKPFWGGTYFPHEETETLPSFREVLDRISGIWTSAPDEVEVKAADLMSRFARERSSAGDGRASNIGGMARQAAQALLAALDPEHGGLIGTSKFPYPCLIGFLWNAGRRTGRSDFMKAAERTVRAFLDGGLYDHVGGGFFRYAVDERWSVPHFEKMLYDNALLLQVLTKIWRIKPSAQLGAAVERTVDWLMREMRLPGGAFASSLDAESEGQEGACYVWTEAEIDAVLGARAADFMRGCVLEKVPALAGGVLRLRPRTETGDPHSASTTSLLDLLWVARQRRPRPRRDDKVLADWNGLAIAALSTAGVAFDRPDWIAAAAGAFDFIARNMTRGDALAHSWRNGNLGTTCVLDDYANMALAGLCLHEATGAPGPLGLARAWTESCIGRFHDTERGDFFQSPEDAGMPIRLKEGVDGVTPSGNAVMAQVLARLYLLTAEDRYRVLARGVIDAWSADMSNDPDDAFRYAGLLEAHQLLVAPTQIVIVGPIELPATRALVQAAHRHAPPDAVILPLATADALPQQHPAFAKRMIAGVPTGYVCAGSSCSLPVCEPDRLAEVLSASAGTL